MMLTWLAYNMSTSHDGPWTVVRMLILAREESQGTGANTVLILELEFSEYSQTLLRVRRVFWEKGKSVIYKQ